MFDNAREDCGQPRLSFSLVESVLGEINPQLEQIESDVDAIFHSTISSVDQEPVTDLPVNSPSSTSIGTDWLFFYIFTQPNLE
jgi:hypothetical protein